MIEGLLQLTLNCPGQLAQDNKPYKPKALEGTDDDHRCFIVPWDSKKEKYVTGFNTLPDKKAIVHHTILFAVSGSRLAEFRKLEAKDSEPGYTCFGGPGGQRTGMFKWIAAWAPGGKAYLAPKDTGIKLDVGDFFVIQMHYNILYSGAEFDQTGFELQLSDSVKFPAATVPFTDFQWLAGNGMDIPKNKKEVSHSYTHTIGKSRGILDFFLSSIGLSENDPISIHTVGLHMHTLGTTAKLETIRKGGDNECMLNIKKWDFNWQGSYNLKKPIHLEKGDGIKLSCKWNNSIENQLVISGKRRDSINVKWGDDTHDEMCLGIIYVTKKVED